MEFHPFSQKMEIPLIWQTKQLLTLLELPRWRPSADVSVSSWWPWNHLSEPAQISPHTTPPRQSRQHPECVIILDTYFAEGLRGTHNYLVSFENHRSRQWVPLLSSTYNERKSKSLLCLRYKGKIPHRIWLTGDWTSGIKSCNTQVSGNLPYELLKDIIRRRYLMFGVTYIYKYKVKS